MPLVDHAILLHGYAESPDRVWFPWLHKELEDRGIRVTAPALPDPLRPNFQRWLRKITPIAKTMGGGTVLIGHSIGGVLGLRFLEKRLAKPIAGVITVGSPFASTINVELYTRFFDRQIDWWTLKGAAKRFVVIHAEDDPLVPFDHALRYREALEADLHLLKKGAHFTRKKAVPILKALLDFRADS
jgi:hypothetical protein